MSEPSKTQQSWPEDLREIAPEAPSEEVEAKVREAAVGAFTEQSLESDQPLFGRKVFIALVLLGALIWVVSHFFLRDR